MPGLKLFHKYKASYYKRQKSDSDWNDPFTQFLLQTGDCICNGRNNRRHNDRLTVKTKSLQIGPVKGNFKTNGKMTGLSADSGDSEATILCEFFKSFCRI